MKRPFADNLVKELLSHYEIILWTKEQYPVRHLFFGRFPQISQKLVSQWGLPTMGILHLDDCNDFGVKDLSRLGRDLSKVVAVDTTVDNYAVRRLGLIAID